MLFWAVLSPCAAACMCLTQKQGNLCILISIHDCCHISILILLFVVALILSATVKNNDSMGV